MRHEAYIQVYNYMPLPIPLPSYGGTKRHASQKVKRGVGKIRDQTVQIIATRFLEAKMQKKTISVATKPDGGAYSDPQTSYRHLKGPLLLTERIGCGE